MKKERILVVCGKVVLTNSKIDWPDLNYPGSGLTILRTVQAIDLDKKAIQLDAADGPWFKHPNLPQGVAFYEKC